MAIDRAVLRCICPTCRKEYDISFSLLLDKIEEIMSEEDVIPNPKGLVVHPFCDACVPADKHFNTSEEFFDFMRRKGN